MIALKDNLPTDTPALHAQPVKLYQRLINNNAMFQDVLVHSQSEPQLTTSTVVDARIAHSHVKFQMQQELLVSIDHSLFAMTALQDNLPIDTLARNAQLDKFKILKILKDATLQLVPDNTKLEVYSISSTAVDVRLANGQCTCQMLKELSAC
jgi:hypothetical protein